MNNIDEFLQKMTSLINFNLVKPLQQAKSSSFIDFFEEMNKEE